MRPIIVNLDQNAASGLALQREEDSGWARLYDVLLSGVAAGNIVSPIPYETELETVPCTLDRRERIEALLLELSHGLRFKGFWEILEEETIALGREQVDLCPLKMPERSEISPPWMSAAWVRQLKKVMQLRLDAFTHTDERSDLTVLHIQTELTLSRCGDFYRNLENLRNGAPLNPEYNMTAGICDYLVKNHITPEEIVTLRDAVINHKWEAIPVLHYHNMLSAQAEHDYLQGRVATANDDIDRDRTAVALFAADYYLTEASIFELCKKARVSDLTPTKVFAVRDRARMEADLLSELERRTAVSNG
jgi:hypothetical protein